MSIKRAPNMLAGSIARVDDHWQVEIMWGGLDNAITYEAPSLPRVGMGSTQHSTDDGHSLNASGSR
ncbi:hypothetical protein [Bradyrhizobium sp. LeoA1S1]